MAYVRVQGLGTGDAKERPLRGREIRGGLRPAPDCRPRRALLHLSYSSAPLHADGAFVTQDPLRTQGGKKAFVFVKETRGRSGSSRGYLRRRSNLRSCHCRRFKRGASGICVEETSP